LRHETPWLAGRLMAAGTIGLTAVAALVLVPAAASAAPAGLTAPSANSPVQPGVLAGVSCAAARKCVAVGRSVNRAGAEVPLAERWNGHAWTVLRARLPAGVKSGALTGVSCTSARACTAVGYVDEADTLVPLAERWNGRRWAIQRTRIPARALGSVLTGVSCPSARKCLGVGEITRDSPMPLAERWNGRRWAIQRIHGRASEDNTLTGISCASARKCIAVGSSVNGDMAAMPLAERWNGRRWAIQRIPDPAGLGFTSLRGISCASARACKAVGRSANLDDDAALVVAERWNGRRWAIQRIRSPAGFVFSSLSGVSCASARACIAAGFSAGNETVASSVPLSERWNGVRWAIKNVPVPGAATASHLTAVSCTSARACVAVGFYQDSTGADLVLAERWNGSAWTLLN